MKPIHIKKGDGERLKTSESIEVNILISGNETNNNISLFESTVQPGGSPPRHIHKDHDETFFVREGKFIIEIDKKIIKAEVGDISFVPRGTIHTFKNVGDTVGVLQYFFTPYLNMETFFKEVIKLSMPNDKMALEALLKKYDNVIMGPPLT